MDTAELMIITGAGAVAVALAILAYLLGSWRAEHRAAREYVDLLGQREALARQRAALNEQRAALGRQRVYLEQIDERRRTQRLPSSGSVRPHPGTSVDDDPTREIHLPPALRIDHLNKRGHRRHDEQ